MISKLNLVLRSISLLLIGVFCLQEISYSAPLYEGFGVVGSQKPLDQISQDPTRFEAPLDYSSLKEIHKGTSDTFIIHIQDAHSNLSGQENLASAIDAIMSKYGVSLILTEGSSKEATLDPIKKLAPSKELLKRVARSFLIQGKIAGEEYLNLTSDRPMKIMGIEDRALYLKSIENYGLLSDKRENALSYLKTIQRALDKLKQKLYPTELLNYENQSQDKQRFESNFKELLSIAQNRNIDLNDLPNIQKLAVLQEKEKKIDFIAANIEQAALLEEISQKGGKEDFESQLKKLRRMKNQKVPQFAFFQNTFNIAHDQGISLEKYSNLISYGNYLKEFSDLDLEQVLDELTSAEERIYVTLLSDIDSRLVRSIDRYITHLITAYYIQMTTKDFKFFEDNEPDFSTAAYLSFINRKLVELGYFDGLVTYKTLLEEGKTALVNFYDSVDKRDMAFIQNTERIIKQENQKVAVLISGGYHTLHLKKLMQEKGYSYAVLTPEVTSETNQEKYEKRLLFPVRKVVKRIEHTQGESSRNYKSFSALEEGLVRAKKTDGLRVSAVAMDPANGDSGVTAFARGFGLPSNSYGARLAIQTIVQRPDNPISVGSVLQTGQPPTHLARNNNNVNTPQVLASISEMPYRPEWMTDALAEQISADPAFIKIVESAREQILRAGPRAETITLHSMIDHTSDDSERSYRMARQNVAEGFNLTHANDYPNGRSIWAGYGEWNHGSTNKLAVLQIEFNGIAITGSDIFWAIEPLITSYTERSNLGELPQPGFQGYLFDLIIKLNGVDGMVFEYSGMKSFLIKNPKSAQSKLVTNPESGARMASGQAELSKKILELLGNYISLDERRLVETAADTIVVPITGALYLTHQARTPPMNGKDLISAGESLGWELDHLNEVLNSVLNKIIEKISADNLIDQYAEDFARAMARHYFKAYFSPLTHGLTPTDVDFRSSLEDQILDEGTGSVAILGVGLRGVHILSRMSMNDTKIAGKKIYLTDNNRFITTLLSEYKILVSADKAIVIEADAAENGFASKVMEPVDQVLAFRVLHEIGRTTAGVSENKTNHEGQVSLKRAAPARQVYYANIAELLSTSGVAEFVEVFNSPEDQSYLRQELSQTPSLEILELETFTDEGLEGFRIRLSKAGARTANEKRMDPVFHSLRIKASEDLFITPDILGRAMEIFSRTANVGRNDMTEMKRLVEHDGIVGRLENIRFPVASAHKARRSKWPVDEEASLLAEIVKRLGQNASLERPLNAADAAIYLLVQNDKTEFLRIVSAMLGRTPRISIHPFLVKIVDGTDPGLGTIKAMLENTFAHERFHLLFDEGNVYFYQQVAEKVISVFQQDEDFKLFYDALMKSYGHKRGSHGLLLVTEEFWAQLYFNSRPERSYQEKMTRLRERIYQYFKEASDTSTLEIMDRLNLNKESARQQAQLDVQAVSEIGAISNKGLLYEIRLNQDRFDQLQSEFKNFRANFSKKRPQGSRLSPENKGSQTPTTEILILTGPAPRGVDAGRRLTALYGTVNQPWIDHPDLVKQINPATLEAIYRKLWNKAFDLENLPIQFVLPSEKEGEPRLGNAIVRYAKDATGQILANLFYLDKEGQEEKEIYVGFVPISGQAPAEEVLKTPQIISSQGPSIVIETNLDEANLIEDIARMGRDIRASIRAIMTTPFPENSAYAITRYIDPGMLDANSAPAKADLRAMVASHRALQKLFNRVGISISVEFLNRQTGEVYSVLGSEDVSSLRGDVSDKAIRMEMDIPSEEVLKRANSTGAIFIALPSIDYNSNQTGVMDHFSTTAGPIIVSAAKELDAKALQTLTRLYGTGFALKSSNEQKEAFAIYHEVPTPQQLQVYVRWQIPFLKATIDYAIKLAEFAERYVQTAA